MVVNGFLCVFLAGGDEDSFCVPHHHINRVSHWITNFEINHSPVLKPHILQTTLRMNLGGT